MVAPAQPVATAARAVGAAQGGIASARGRKRTLEATASGSGYFETGARILVHANFDSTAHPAEIIEQRATAAGASYYVHYVDFDKRLDEWVNEDRVVGIADTSQPALTSIPSLGVADDQKMTRRLKRKFDEIHHVGQDKHELNAIDQQMEEEHQERTKVKNIQSVELGRFEIFTWYYSPYPEPYNQLDKLYVCEFCLKYFRKKTTLIRHCAKCDFTHPPGGVQVKQHLDCTFQDGVWLARKLFEYQQRIKRNKLPFPGDEIYRSPPKRAGHGAEPSSGVMDPTIAVFEVDGSKHKIYCQSLCLLSKLFLDHKTLYYDVDPFLFYILCEEINGVYHIVGYFSKEKHSADNNNLACILIFPPHQKKGYGGFIMQFSYELSKKEGKWGSPERPLSDLGAVAYRAYWSRVLLQILQRHPHVSIKDLVEITSIKESDVTDTLYALGCIKYWKGEHILAPQGKIVDEILEELDKKKMVGIDVSRLHWTPFSSVQPTLTGAAAGH